VSVNFCRGDGGMTEEFLDDAEVGAVFEEVSCKAVAQHVRSDVSADASATDALFDSEPESDCSERGAAFGQKNVGRRARRYELGAAD